MGTHPLNSSPSHLRIAVGIVTSGRPSIVPEVIAELTRQVRPPDRLLVCYASPDDIAAVAPGSAELVPSSPGIAAQRNRVVELVDDCDIIVFFDDDFLPAPRWLRQAETLFAAQGDVVVMTGAVIADGIKGPGITPETARALLLRDRGGAGIATVGNGYGCNMALRLAPMRQHRLLFDERLPLYGWYEDVDLTRRLGAFGRIVRDNTARGVHLGVKIGRVTGTRTGYSQIANPIYLAGKGSCPPFFALCSIARNVAANLGRSIRPEPWVDRRGRLVGNCLALADLVRGRLSPERILEL